jgi:outer membrane protein OmpA-like peptidoglycan-associated protein
MENEDQVEIKALIEDYFQELKLSAQQFENVNRTQISYHLNTTAQDPVKWSKLWHAEYESRLQEIVKLFLVDYFSNKHEFPSSIKDAAIKKQAYYSITNSKDRNSDYTKTNLNIALTNISIKAFSEENLSPNLSLNRAVTNSFYSFYNEAYPVQDISKPYVFVFGPSNKARLKDCVAMHLFVKLNKLPEVIYLSNYMVLVLDSLNQAVEVDQESLKALLSNVEVEITKIINDPAYSFYNTDDKQSLHAIIEEFELNDYHDFEVAYLDQNSSNVAQPIKNLSLCYNKAILESTIDFKQNAPFFKTEMDSSVLNSLALFLINNKLKNLVIIGHSASTEYTKIDNKKYLQIVNKYEEYTPVKSSRKADLSIYRAVTVFDYLIQKGVDPTSLTCMSKALKNKEATQSVVNFTFR